MFALKAVVAAGLALLLIACSSNEEPAYQEQPVDTLYNAAMEELLGRNYVTAAQRFEEVERQHPYSIWAAKAQVMGAYAYFREDKYDDAINAADRFIQLHPTSPDAPYAYYLKALAYYEQIVDVGRDQRTTGRALDALERQADGRVDPAHVGHGPIHGLFAAPDPRHHRVHLSPAADHADVTGLCLCQMPECLFIMIVSPRHDNDERVFVDGQI